MDASIPNDCMVLADAFPSLNVWASNSTPAICCERNITEDSGLILNRIVCRSNRIVFL
ncbi:hypothetical protein HDU96_006843, partial [Phlyctochytrium bullatum]